MTDLLELAQRVEQASGADRELAKEIFRALFPERVPELGHPNGYGWREDDSGWWLATGEDARTPPKTVYPPAWLTSLDAAMTLVPEGCGWRLWVPASDSDQRHRATIWAARGMPMFAPFDVEAATPALALCAAALRTRAAMEPTP